jgi:RHS repeat-associated protein
MKKWCTARTTQAAGRLRLNKIFSPVHGSSSSRRLVRDYKTAPDWETFPEPEDRPEDWEEELFLSSTRYDALNRPIQLVAPHAGSETDVIQPGYNEANLLERLDVWLKHAGEPAELLASDTADEHFVTNIDYNARGQRTLIQYGNDAETRYHYDPATFRLVQLYTRRDVSYSDDCGDETSRYPAPDMPPQDTPCGLQNLHYTYDPVGNIIAIRDDAQQTIYFDGEVVRPEAKYKYDAIYRLIEACGREHIGQVAQPHTTWNDEFRVNQQHPNNSNAMRNYTEKYEYDGVGNILHFNHYANGGSWIRNYTYEEPSLIETGQYNNRLSYTLVGYVTEPYTYDPHGNMTSMPHLPQMVWDFRDQLHMVDKGGGCMAYYVYDAGGQRVRKVIEQNGRRMKERIYLGGFEVYRKYNVGESSVKLERETLHVMDGQQRIALVETRTQGEDDSLPQLIRYQFGNHLGSASLELDHQAQIISYEEYYPYGSTSYQAVRSQTEVPKRYRYTGMERDEETGLCYYGYRYLSSWLAIWVQADRLGPIDSLNLYRFARSNPIKFYDRNGLESAPASPEVEPSPQPSDLPSPTSPGPPSPTPSAPPSPSPTPPGPPSPTLSAPPSPLTRVAVYTTGDPRTPPELTGISYTELYRRSAEAHASPGHARGFSSDQEYLAYLQGLPDDSVASFDYVGHGYPASPGGEGGYFLSGEPDPVYDFAANSANQVLSTDAGPGSVDAQILQEMERVSAQEVDVRFRACYTGGTSLAGQVQDVLRATGHTGTVRGTGRWHGVTYGLPSAPDPSASSGPQVLGYNTAELGEEGHPVVQTTSTSIEDVDYLEVDRPFGPPISEEIGTSDDPLAGLETEIVEFP